MDVNLTTPTYFSSSATMEIPYAEAFSWPFQTNTSAAGYNASYQAGSGDQQVEMQDAGHGPLTAEDVAAFMHINPGNDPFA